MLIHFRVSNYRSIRDPQDLSMVASDGGREDVIRLEGVGLDLLRVAAIYGPNAAGKSNVLRALEFMRDAVRGSHRSWKPDGPIPREPFLLDREWALKPSSFELHFLVEGVRYEYGFEVDDEKVLSEWLYAYPHQRRQVWFERDVRAQEPFDFGKNLKGNNRTIAGLTRVNSLFLSVAAENNHQALLPIYSALLRLRFAGYEDRAERLLFTIKLLDKKEDKESVLDLLRLADLGISDLEVLRENAGESLLPRLLLKHRSREGLVALPIDDESNGTRAWLSLAGPLLHVLNTGSVLLVDELDASLHPRLSLEVLRIFQDPRRNPQGAQLVFTSHDTTLLGNLLGESELHRDQIWFVDKDKEGGTCLYPLSDFRPRKDENLERGYLQGRYGAVPFVERSLRIAHG